MLKSSAVTVDPRCVKKKHLINTFLVVLLFLILVDATPSTSLAHQKLKDTIDPLLDVTGLWQETWQLFAPEPDKVNVKVTAHITCADGSSRFWSRVSEIRPKITMMIDITDASTGRSMQICEILN